MSDSPVVAATDGYDITVSPRVDTPTRKITRKGNEFDVSTLGRVDAGDVLSATITAPDGEHSIEVRPPEKEPIYGFYGGEAGETERTFDTASMPGTDTELPPGTYIIAAASGSTLYAVSLFVNQGYRVSTDLPPVFDPSNSVDVTVDIEPIPSPDTSLDGAELRIWSETEGTQTISLTAVDETTYEATISDPPAEPFNAYAAATRRVPESNDIDSEVVGISDKNRVETAVDTLAEQASSPLKGRTQAATPAVTSSHVVCGGLGAEVRAYTSVGSDTPDWDVERAGSLSDSAPVISDGDVYVGSGGGVVYALDAGTGTPSWTFPDDEAAGVSAFTGSPTVSGGTVYIGANDGIVYALDTADGSQRWAVDAGGPVYSQPAVSDGVVYVTTADGRLVAIEDTASASVAWNKQVATEFGSSGPAVASQTVYTAGDTVSAFTAGNSGGTRRWLTDEYGGTAGSTPIISNGKLYVGSADEHVYAIDADPAGTGVVEWRHKMDSPVAAQPETVDGRVLACSVNGRAILLDGATGTPRAAEQLGDSLRAKPVVDGSTVYLGTDADAGRVVALDINQL
jgi:outer membrane protein assembly factor BamB